jgi:branched-chain amino acid transport system permease protein
VFRAPPRASGYFRTDYGQDLKLIQSRAEWSVLLVFMAILIVTPFVASPFLLDLCSQVFLASVGALSLMLLTGYAGQISLGHAGLIAAGAFTTGILAREANAPFWITLPASALTGTVLGLIFGLPSLRLRGLYLAVSTLALHFVVIYLGGEYETNRGFSTGILIDPPALFGWKISGARVWYFILLAFSASTLLACITCAAAPAARFAPSARRKP